MAARDREFTKTEIKAGFLVLFSTALFIVFIAAVIGYRPQGQGKVFYANFDATGGLRPGADVRFGGLKAGRIVAIDPSPEDQSLIRATALVRQEIPVNADSMVYVTQMTLTSDMHLEITTGSAGAALLDGGATLPSGTGGLFGQLAAVAEDVGVLLEDVTVLLGVHDVDGNETMDAEEQQTIAELFASLEGLAADLRILVGVTDEAGEPTMTEEEMTTAAELFNDIDSTVQDSNDLVNDLGDMLEDNRPNIDKAVEGLTELEESATDLINDLDSLLEDNRENIDSALDNLDDVLAEAEVLILELGSLTGSLDGFFEKNEPVLEDILLDLRETMRNLDEFSRTLADQPSSIIRGKQEQGRK